MISLTKDIDSLYKQLISYEPNPITDLICEIKKNNGELHKNYPSGWKFKSFLDESLPSLIDQGGIYVFWWRNKSSGDLDPFYQETCTRSYQVQGKQIIGHTGEIPAYHQIEINFSDEWLEQYRGDIPLYVGKSADSILKRVRQHLQINHTKYKGKTTADQLRRGIERLFYLHPHTANLIKNHVEYSFIPLHGVDDVINRFYLEDYAIGKLRPLFNIDIER
ncbi:hypothetical protein [Shouchella patagoniensis]|uniref:hypothetical protein n=1 Tax=Shouchella patagoniensis TaxID=228576 RepID=UPI000994E599|nr:hypothetical protein [Shouchella patagoniensis]